MQCCIYGDSLRDYIIGFLVLEPAAVKKWAEENGVQETNSIVDNEDLRMTIYKDLL